MDTEIMITYSSSFLIASWRWQGMVWAFLLLQAAFPRWCISLSFPSSKVPQFRVRTYQQGRQEHQHQCTGCNCHSSAYRSWGWCFLVMKFQLSWHENGNIIVKVETTNKHGKKVIEGTAEVAQPPTAYVFTSQGSQEPGMGMDLYKSSPLLEWFGTVLMSTCLQFMASPSLNLWRRTQRRRLFILVVSRGRPFVSVIWTWPTMSWIRMEMLRLFLFSPISTFALTNRELYCIPEKQSMPIKLDQS